jgi:hypothetical protein
VAIVDDDEEECSMRRVLALMLFVSCSGVVRAQSTNASISGRVTDPTGAVIVGAQVAAINTGTNFRLCSRICG